MQSQARRLTHKTHIGGSRRGARFIAGRFGLVALVCLLALLPATEVFAQNVGEGGARGSFRLPAMPSKATEAAAPEVAAAGPWTMPKVIVDTDTGVDDAAALAWLFTQAGDDPSKIVGIATVAGNTTVENATENVLFLLAQTPWKTKHWPAVFTGASAPLERVVSKIGQLQHGLDGLGYARASSGWTSNGRTNRVTQGTTDFYCGNAKEGSESAPITVITLGPLTNIALALDEDEGCPALMRNYRYFVLGATRVGGNQTVTAEYNVWQDPEAAQKVLGAGLDITLVPREQFDKFTLTLSQVEWLLRSTPLSPRDSWGRTANAVGQALCWYVGIQSFDFATGDTLDYIPVSVPDPVAMMFALNPSGYSVPSWDGSTVSKALVRVPTDVNDPENPGYRDGILVRGQSVIGYYEPYPEAYTMAYSDLEINKWIDESFEAAGGDPFVATALFYYTLFAQQEEISANAAIPVNLDGDLMQQDFLRELRVEGPPQRSCFPEFNEAIPAAAVLSGLRLGGSGAGVLEESPESSVFIPLLSR